MNYLKRANNQAITNNILGHAVPVKLYKGIFRNRHHYLLICKGYKPYMWFAQTLGLIELSFMNPDPNIYSP